MSFWNNPENNSLKTILIVLVIAALGFFVYKYMQTNSLGGEGRVINVRGGTVNVMQSAPTNDMPTRPGTTDKQACKIELKRSAGGDCIRVNADCSVSPATGCSAPTGPSDTI